MYNPERALFLQHKFFISFEGKSDSYSSMATCLLQVVLRRRVANSEIFTGLSNVLEEAASIIVIMRLWRVFKIIEEFSAEASDRQYYSNLLNPDLHKDYMIKQYSERKVIALFD